MGLDMYLNKKVYIGANYEHNNISGIIDLKHGNEPIKVDFNKVVYIEERVAYWRKANHIHNWFVKNIQNGNDDREEYYVSFKDLLELFCICREIVKTKSKKEKLEKAKELLPTCSGFFFGGEEYDKYYFDNTKYTMRMIANLDRNADYYYDSSW